MSSCRKPEIQNDLPKIGCAKKTAENPFKHTCKNTLKWFWDRYNGKFLY